MYLKQLTAHTEWILWVDSSMQWRYEIYPYLESTLTDEFGQTLLPWVKAGEACSICSRSIGQKEVFPEEIRSMFAMQLPKSNPTRFAPQQVWRENISSQIFWRIFYIKLDCIGKTCIMQIVPHAILYFSVWLFPSYSKNWFFLNTDFIFLSVIGSTTT